MPLRPRTFETPPPVRSGTQRPGLSYPELYPCDTLGRTFRPSVCIPSLSPRMQLRKNTKDIPQPKAITNGEPTAAKKGTPTARDSPSVPKEINQDRHIIGINESSEIVNEENQSVLDQASINRRNSSLDCPTSTTTAADEHMEQDKAANLGIGELVIERAELAINKAPDVIEDDDDVFHKQVDVVQKEPMVEKPVDPVVHDHIEIAHNPMVHSKSLPPRVNRAALVGSQSTSFESYLEIGPLRKQNNPQLHPSEHLDLEDETSFIHPMQQDTLAASIAFKSASLTEIDSGNITRKLSKQWSSTKSGGNLSKGGSNRSINWTPEFSSGSTLSILDSYLPTALQEHRLIPINMPSDVTESGTDNEGVFIPEQPQLVRSPTAATTGGMFIPDDTYAASDSEGVFIPENSRDVMPAYHLPLHASQSLSSQEYPEMGDRDSTLSTGYASGMSSLSTGYAPRRPSMQLSPTDYTTHGTSSQLVLTPAPSTINREQKNRRQKVLVIVGVLSVLCLIALAIAIPIVFSLFPISEAESQDQLIISNCPNDIIKHIQGPESKTRKMTWVEPTAVDREGNNAILIHQTYYPGVSLSKGTVEVIYFFVDRYYQSSDECKFNITVLPPRSSSDASSPSYEPEYYSDEYLITTSDFPFEDFVTPESTTVSDGD